MSPAQGRGEHPVYSLPRIHRETFVREVEFYPSINSTNTRAMELASMDDAKLPLLVLTESQTAGKGRGVNQWWSPPGAIAFSLLINLGDQPVGPESWPRFALCTALAVCEALEVSAPGVSFGIRWPNDVCHGVRKICGILPELCATKPARLVLGVGVNVNNSTGDAPAAIKESATSLFDLTGRRVNLTEILIDIMLRIEYRFGQLLDCAPELSHAWSDRCLLRGKTVCVKFNHVEIEGECAGIAATGALALQTPTGTQRFYGGTVAIRST